MMDQHFLGAYPVGAPGGVAQEDHVLVGEELEQLLGAGQSSDAGVEHSDGLISHSLLPEVPAR